MWFKTLFLVKKILVRNRNIIELDYDFTYRQNIEVAISQADNNDSPNVKRPRPASIKTRKIEFQKEAPYNFQVYAFEMQKVLLRLELSTKENIFVSCLLVFNETFARMGAAADLELD